MSLKKIKIHFVCRGNIYRSRTAEAYLKSLNLPLVEVSSSGIYADENSRNEVSDWAVEILKDHKISKYLSPYCSPTTKKIIDEQDVIIFVKDNVYLAAKEKFNITHKSIKVWNIKDNDEWFLPLPKNIIQKLTFREIKKQIDNLVRELGL